MITVATLILVAAALLSAVLVRPGDLPRQEAPPRAKSDAERRATLEEGLRDLEFEFRLGKLSQSDYEQTRKEMEQELAQLGGPAKAAPPVPEAAATVCPHCGARFPAPLKFCGECGQPMRRAPA